MKRTGIAALAALVCATAASAADPAAAPKPTPPFKIAPGANVVSSPSGLQYVDVIVGKGEPPKPGDICIVHYTAWLEDGTQIDSSLEPRPRDPRDPSKGEKVLPFGFALGAGQVLKGWDEGVATMREGGSRLLFVPPHLGYGSKGLGNAIPAESRLTFKIDLVKIKRAQATGTGGQGSAPTTGGEPTPGP